MLFPSAEEGTQGLGPGWGRDGMANGEDFLGEGGGMGVRSGTASPLGLKN